MSENEKKKLSGKADGEPAAPEAAPPASERAASVPGSAPPAQKTETVVYIGPDIPGAKQYTTYNAGLPDALKEKIKEYPFFKALVVPVEKLARAGAELAQEGSALSILYQRAGEK